MSDSHANDMLVVLRHSPHGSSWLREGLEAALVAAAFGRGVSLLFSGEGVMALLDSQQPGPLGQKGTQPMLEMLPMYDIDAFWVDVDTLRSLGLKQDDLIFPVAEMAREAFPDFFQQHQLILNF
ncbi:sulfurtransferase complex subunit TusC [Aidingimonas lacisalsi]|uniref:sulfurtransferase complex subunit TusC n=1 Tax=Aidingimonas lacisalsi TaxID=2604086 RepID=UPI0011D1FC85|nr:sulfurtransferase complex subunit TusC [Aidingimonas lacisalsi]